MRQFLDKIRCEHVLQAGRYLLVNPADGKKASRTRTVIIEGHPFPPKEVIRRAYCFATSTHYDNLPVEFTVTNYNPDIAQKKLKELDFTVYKNNQRL
ncbi:hypothetical protein [Spirosoma jeollabukense]